MAILSTKKFNIANTVKSGAFAPDILITQKTNIYIQNRTTLRKLVAIASAPRTKTAL